MSLREQENEGAGLKVPHQNGGNAECYVKKKKKKSRSNGCSRGNDCACLVHDCELKVLKRMHIAFRGKTVLTVSEIKWWCE